MSVCWAELTSATAANWSPWVGQQANVLAKPLPLEKPLVSRIGSLDAFKGYPLHHFGTKD
jgi:hypothetical protein